MKVIKQRHGITVLNHIPIKVVMLCCLTVSSVCLGKGGAVETETGLIPISPKCNVTSKASNSSSQHDEADSFTLAWIAFEYASKTINCDYSQAVTYAHQQFERYRLKVAQSWPSPIFSTSKQWVTYSDDLKIRRQIDFEHDHIVVEVIGDMDSKGELAKQQIRELAELTVNEAQQLDRYAASVTGQVPDTSQNRTPILPLPSNKTIRNAEVQSALQAIKVSRYTDTQGKTVSKAVVPFPAAWLSRKEQRYIGPVQKYAAEYGLDPNLVLAVIKVESAFDPVAVSHIPAFGLMQIVPSSAGLDATEYLYGHQRLLSRRELFNPDKNIQLGAIYLHLLQSRYFNGIDDPESLKHCVVAAYNGGMAPIYRLFGQGTKQSAIEAINRLSPDEVYRVIQTQHYAAETRHYLVKVNKALSQYQNASS